MLKVNKTENIQSCWTSEVFSEYNIVLAALFGEIKVYIFEDQYTVHRWHTS